MTPLTQDYGPAWRAMLRAKREKHPSWIERNWKKLATICALWISACVFLAMVGITQAFAYDYPPEEYTHEPIVAVHITHKTLGKTMRACEQLINQTNLWGCMRFIGETCVVYLPEQGGPVSWANYQRMREHELAHCNGWKHPVRGNRVYPTSVSLDPRERLE